MKKHIIILAAFFVAALFVSACNPEDTPQVKSQGLTLSLFCGEPETKAPDTDPFAFENAIDHFDFFFFKDAAGTQPIRGMHGRVTGSEKVLDTSENGEFSALRKGTSYVYILANYPGPIDHSADKTLAQLLAMDVNAPIITATEKKLNPITGDMEETGNVTYCNALVMDSYQKATDTYTTQLTPRAIEEERTVTIELSRLSAKLSLTITVEPSAPGSMTYTDSQGHEHQEVWTPVLKDLRAYFVNALNNKTTVSAEPIRRSAIPAADVAAYEYLTYPTRYALAADASDDHKFLSAPVYTYTQEWSDIENGEPYFKIQIPWESSLRGSSNFYYKVALPKSESNKRTLNRNMHYQVTVDLSVIDTENEYVELNGSYVVTPWLASGWTGGNGLNAAKFFSVPVTTYEVYSQEEVTIPFYSSSAVHAFFTNIEYKHYRDGGGTTYTFSNTDETVSSYTFTSTQSGDPVIARDKNEYSLTVVGNSVIFNHALTDVYTVRTVELTIKNLDGEFERVIIKQHPAIEVKSRPAGTVFINGHFARALESVHVNGDASKKMGVPFVLHFNPGQGETRYHSDDKDFTGHATTYNDNTDNLTYWFDGGSYAGGEGTSPNIISNVNYGRYGWIEGDVNRTSPVLYMAEVTVSAFDGTNNTYTYSQDGSSHSKKFVLGDPRVEAGSRFTILSTTPDRAVDGNPSNYRQGGGYLFQSSTVRNSDETTTEGDAIYKAWEQPEKIMISSTDELDGALIAPHFIISSFFNAQPNSLTFENCLKRAATYQEAGFPAGRWRLPTEAEIMFVVQQQQRGVIPRIYAPGSSYWCADGRYVTIANSGDTVSFHNAAPGATRVNRFVYDLWYWGDEPMADTETYWANKHEH